MHCHVVMACVTVVAPSLASLVLVTRHDGLVDTLLYLSSIVIISGVEHKGKLKDLQKAIKGAAGERNASYIARATSGADQIKCFHLKLDGPLAKL